MDLSLIKSLSKKVNLFYLIDLPPYAIQSTFLEIKNQHSVSAIFESKTYAEFEEYSSFLELSKTYIINRQSIKAYSLSNLRLQSDLIKFISSINPDIIHSNNFLNFNFLLFLLKNKNPIVLTDHDPFPHSGEDSFKNSLIRKLNYRFINNYILLNSVQKSEYLETYKENEKNVYISSLGVYTYLREPSYSFSKTKTNRILFFGRISQYKGLEYLIEAFRMAKKEIQDIKMTIAGAGDFHFNLNSDLDNSSLTIINRYVTKRELVTLISEAKFVVCPYTDATQSGVVMTSFALGTPVIATKVGGLIESVTDGVTGLLVPPKDAQALAKAISFLFKNDKLITQMTRNIEEIYLHGYRSWDSISDRLIPIYENILNREHRNERK